MSDTPALTRELVHEDDTTIVYRLRDEHGFDKGWDTVTKPTAEQQVEVTLRDRVQQRIDLLQALIDYPAVASAAGLQSIIDAPALPAVPAGTLTTAVLSDVVRTLRDAVQANRAGIQTVASYVMALRGVAQENRAGAQAVAEQVRDLMRLTLGDFGPLD